VGELATLVAACLARPDVDAETARALAALGDCAAALDRASPLHVTGSALVVHRPSRRLLLRYHEQVGGFIQLGGHADPGEEEPFAVARREAAEESGLRDLTWEGMPAPAPLSQVVVVEVPGPGAHRHLDFRYLLFTEAPERAVAEHDGAPLLWVGVDEATGVSTEENLRPLFAAAAASC